MKNGKKYDQERDLRGRRFPSLRGRFPTNEYRISSKRDLRCHRLNCMIRSMGRTASHTLVIHGRKSRARPRRHVTPVGGLGGGRASVRTAPSIFPSRWLRVARPPPSSLPSFHIRIFGWLGDARPPSPRSGSPRGNSSGTWVNSSSLGSAFPVWKRRMTAVTFAAPARVGSRTNGLPNNCASGGNAAPVVEPPHGHSYIPSDPPPS